MDSARWLVDQARYFPLEPVPFISPQLGACRISYVPSFRAFVVRVIRSATDLVLYTLEGNTAPVIRQLADMLEPAPAAPASHLRLICSKEV